MQATFYGNTASVWGLAAVTALAIFGGLALVRRILMGRLAVFAERTHNELDDLLLALVRGTRTWFLAAIALFGAARFLVLQAGAQRAISAIAVIALITQGAIWGNLLIAHFVQRHLHRSDQDPTSATTIGAVGIVAKLVLWSVLLLLGLDNLGVDITALVAGLGVGGIAVALALQNILGDLFASLSIVLDKPFVNGDFIIVGDLMGTVEHVGLKTTRVRSLHGEQIIFANADLLGSRIRNYKRMQERRILFTLGVTYDTPPGKAEAIVGIIREIIDAIPRVRFDRAHFKSYGAYSLDYEVVYYVLEPDYNVYMDVQHEINLALLRRFAHVGIEFAFPTQTLHVAGGVPALARSGP
jgi:small-conductance mechanosensitive channel